MTKFTLEVLQAINDWQRGGDHKQKVRRGAKLQDIALTLPERFRIFSGHCYRQEAHEKDRVWQLLAENVLPETIASWTSDLSTAKTFKGGVPPEGLQGVIFEIVPPADSVVLNLVEIYADSAFLAAVNTHRREIVGFGSGIGQYGASQNEVVLELKNLNSATIYSYGGYASSRGILAKEYFGHEPAPEELAQFDRLCLRAKISERGDWWLSPDGTKNVLARMEPYIENLRQLKH